ncbi:MAG: dienelactone hydrolase family protein [Herbiconiux sp.]|nr:dienelactone hydrolase family protein [Herbiconiux sp.]
MTGLSPQHQHLLDSVPLPPGADVVGERVGYDHAGDRMDGYLAHDAAAPGPRPGVLVLHDWNGEGEYTRVRAQMLARLGYVALVADLFGEGVRPETQEAAAELAHGYYADLPLLRARVEAAFAVLRADPRVDPERIAVVGYCFGGSSSIEFARTGAPLRGAVSIHGGLITHEPADVAQIAAPLLVLTGAADPVVPDEAVLAFENELRQRDDLDWQVVTYSGAPHAFTLPMIENYRPLADVRSWAALRDFLGEVLAE